VFDNAKAGRRDAAKRDEPKAQDPVLTARGPAIAQRQSASSDPQQLKGVSAPEQPRNNLTVGPNIKMKGIEVTDCDTVTVEGEMEATFDSRLVRIAEQGAFTGTVNVDVAEIWGHFDGDLNVRKQLIIYPSGRVSGRISYTKIQVEEGGEISGAISTTATPSAGGPITL